MMTRVVFDRYLLNQSLKRRCQLAQYRSYEDIREDQTDGPNLKAFNTVQVQRHVEGTGSSMQKIISQARPHHSC